LLEGQKMPPEFVAEANRHKQQLQKRVGQIEIDPVQEDAHIFVDGKERGTGGKPIAAPVGQHQVKVLREGFEPVEATVDVGGGLTVRVAAPGHVRPPELASQRAEAGYEPVEKERGEPGPFQVALFGGVNVWASGMPSHDSPGFAGHLAAARRVAGSADGNVAFELGVQGGLVLVSEPNSSDTFVSILAEPALSFALAPRVRGFAKVGLGLLVISGLAENSVFFKGDVKQVTGALSTFEARPSVGVVFELDRAWSLFVSPALAWSPAPSSFFVASSLTRVEIGGGLAYRL
jgi:hypothetical protein